MQIPIDSEELLDREFLEVRAKILQLAASFDRMDRAEGSVADDPRVQKIHQALDVLRGNAEGDRAEQIQLIFSQAYEDDWQAKYGMPSGQ